MKKMFLSAVLVAAMSVICPMFAHAGANNTAAITGTWEQRMGNWYFTRSDGIQESNGWQWVDDNGDGTCECYYFHADGAILRDTVKDGYTLNADGKWVVDGVVQTKKTSEVQAPAKYVYNGEEGVNQNFDTMAMINHITRGYRYGSSEKNPYTGYAYNDWRNDYYIDESRPAWKNGVTNIRLTDCYRQWRYPWNMTDDFAVQGKAIAPGGWFWMTYDAGADYSAMAVNEEGYFMADTTTPDGFYVNKYGVCEINGQEVKHCSGCTFYVSQTPVDDINTTPYTREKEVAWTFPGSELVYSVQLFAHSNSGLTYNHCRGFNTTTQEEILNGFGACAYEH